MPPKRTLNADEQFHLRNALQAATLAALMDSRRWEPGDLAFQGGTCLHLAHGSARFSEDLDFMIRGGLSLDGLGKEIARRLRLPADTAQDLSVSVTASRSDRNPHAFMVTLGGPNVLGSVKVKIELWQTDAAVLKSLKVGVSTITSATGTRTFVPTITLDEILADKVYALGARERLKPRDVFDLWWLMSTPQPPQLQPASLLARLSIYPRGNACDTARSWLADAERRLASIARAQTETTVAADLRRWLPSSWPMSAADARAMLTSASEQLRQGIAIVKAFEASCEPQGQARSE